MGQIMVLVGGLGSGAGRTRGQFMDNKERILVVVLHVRFHPPFLAQLCPFLSKTGVGLRRLFGA